MSKEKRLKNQKVAKKTVKETEDKSQYVFQEKKLDWDLNIRVRHELTKKQQKFLDIILDKKTNIVFLKGDAGTSKSYLTVLAGLKALNAKTQSSIIYIRSPLEVGRTIGHLPGEFSDKVNAYLTPLYDKLDELIPKSEVDMLIKSEQITGTIPNFLRGQNWNAKFIIVDESQNMSIPEMKVVISRYGKHSKLIFLADESQSDAKGNIEFMRYFDLFNNDTSKEYGIQCLSFGREDIVRSPILGYILDKIEGKYTPPEKELMFPQN